MSQKARDLFAQLQAHAAEAAQKRKDRRFSVLCYCVSQNLKTTFEYWGMSNPVRRPDEKLRQKMENFWRKFLDAAAPEQERDFFECCPEESVLEGAVRLHSLFAAVGLGVKLTAHLDSARYAAEKLEAVCKELLEEDAQLLLPPPETTAKILRFDLWRSVLTKSRA